MPRINRRSSAKAANKVSVNFKGVESRTTLPEDDYLLKVAEVSKEEGDKADYLKWKFEVADGKFEGQSVFYNTSLAPQALWNLRNLLLTLGVEVPNDELDIDFEELADLEMMGVIAHDTYEGKRQSRLVDFYATGEGEGAEETEKPSKKKDEDEEKPARSRRGKDKEPEEEPGEKPSRSSRRSRTDEEEEKPARGKAKPSKKAKDLDPVSAEDVEDMDEDELSALNEEYGLDLDLEELKSRRKKVSAVIDALEEKELLEEEKPARGRK